MDDSKRRKRAASRPPRPPVSSVVSEFAPAEESTSADDEEGVSLEELSRSYQRAIAGVEFVADNPVSDLSHPREDPLLTASAHRLGTSDGDQWQPGAPADQVDALESSPSDNNDCPLTPRSILEAILFVGRPDNSPISAAEIAAQMRGVQESEVTQSIAELNELYARTNRPTRIVASGAGYRLQLDEDLSFVRDRFYGRVRQVKLNQAAIDCLALISYQPGITREELESQRGQPSGSLLSQLIRRQLIEMRRHTEKKSQLQRYYPTQRLLDLAGIESLDDLPQTEDLD